MLKFLRRIRKSFVESLPAREDTVKQAVGSAKKYFLYAIGEIVLVVIGILIALQINNWNEWRKDRQHELKILESLLIDFQKNIENLQEAQNIYEFRNNWLAASINLIGTPHYELTASQMDTLRNTETYITPIVEGTLNSVLNSEKLELIVNDSLKKLLTAYPSMISLFKKQEETVEHILYNRLRPILESYVSLFDLLSKDSLTFPNLKEKAATSDFKGLLNDKAYQNALADQFIQTHNLSHLASVLLSATIEISNNIEAYISKIKK